MKFFPLNSFSKKSTRRVVRENSVFIVRREHRAFTLVEILIAVGILGMIMVAIYACWNSILRGSKAGQEAAADAQRGRMAINTVEMALGCALMFESNLKYYSFIADTSGDFAYLSFVGHLPESFPGSGLFGDQVLRRVSFGVENKDGDPQLVMRQMPMLQPLEKGEEAYPIVLAHGVNKFIIEFWEPRKGEWMDAWMQNKQLLTNQLPRRVRVALAFGGRRDRYTKREADVVFRDIALPSITVPRAYQMGVGGPGNPNVPITPTNVVPNPGGIRTTPITPPIQPPR